MTHPVPIRFGKGLAASLAACLAVASHAAPGDTDTASGTANAVVVVPPQIVAIDSLRFGQLISPPTAGTVTIAPNSSITSTLDLTAFPSVRAPARFLVVGERNRRFITSISNSTVISTASSATMIVSALQFTRTTASPINRLNASGTFDLYVGGTLNVQANQQPGQYSGVFEVSVIYL